MNILPREKNLNFYFNNQLNNFSILQMIIFVICMVMSTFVLGDSLVSATTSKISALPNESNISRVWIDNGQLVALTKEALWLLDADRKKWQRKPWNLQKNIIGVASDDIQTFLLFDSTGISRIEKHSVVSNISQNTVLPQLPVQLNDSKISLLKGVLYVSGISEEGSLQLFSIDPLVEQQWTYYDNWQGNIGRITSMVGQNSSILITYSEQKNAGEQMLQWTKSKGWKQRSSLSGHVVEGTSRAIGQGHALYLVAPVKEGKDALRLMSFHTITGAWATIKTLKNKTSYFGTGWQQGILWLQPSEDNNQTELSLIEIEPSQQLLSTIDWGLLIFYLMSMLGIGLYFYNQQAQNSEEDFFLGGRSIPFWAAGISLYASNASSISYIAVPAKAFATNWQYLMSNIIVVFGLIFVAIWVVPLLRRLNLMSVFQYLETRFHPSIRIISSVLFIVFQLGGRMTVILFLPSLAISTVTGFDITWCIMVMGVVTIIYTVLGGMKAVIWTDVIQLFVMFGGTIFAIIYIFMSLDGGVSEFLTIAAADDKMKMVDWSFNLTDATIWGFVFLVFFDTVLTFPKDQVLMQRVLSTPSAKEAGRSMWTFAAIIIPASVMFFLIGTALYAFYQTHPERMNPLLSIDATFPLFIAAELPVGVAGLIIAGIFAAAMSTLSSILNSVSTVVTVDFYDKFVKNSAKSRSNVRFAEIITVVAGIIGMGLALLLSRYEINSLLDVALELWGLLGGGFAGAYTLGMFTQRANWQGVSIGVAASLILTIFAWSINLVHPYFYLPFAVLICIVVGYTASLFFPKPTTLEGLTIYKEDIDTKQVVNT